MSLGHEIEFGGEERATPMFPGHVPLHALFQLTTSPEVESGYFLPPSRVCIVSLSKRRILPSLLHFKENKTMPL